MRLLQHMNNQVSATEKITKYRCRQNQHHTLRSSSLSALNAGNSLFNVVCSASTFRRLCVQSIQQRDIT